MSFSDLYDEEESSPRPQSRGPRVANPFSAASQQARARAVTQSALPAPSVPPQRDQAVPTPAPAPIPYPEPEAELEAADEGDFGWDDEPHAGQGESPSADPNDDELTSDESALLAFFAGEDFDDEEEADDSFDFEEIAEDDEEDEAFTSIPEPALDPSSYTPSWESEESDDGLTDEQREDMLAAQMTPEEEMRLIQESQIPEFRSAQDDSADDEEELEEDDPNGPRDPKKSRGGGAKGKPSGPLALLLLPIKFIWNFYNAVASSVWKILDSIVKILAAIPVVGIPFRLLRNVLHVVPNKLRNLALPIIIALFFFGGTAMIPKTSFSLELPDSGGAKITDLSYDRDKSTVSGTLKNTGDIIADVIPTFTVAESQWYNPVSWFNPKPIGKCEGGEASVDIDAESKVTAKCDFKIPGGWIRLNGDMR